MNSKEIKLNISELFFSKQGEGARAGSENIFVRLQGCKAKDACYASGIRCDTEFESGREMTLEELNLWMLDNAPHADWIIWTGGEPAQQLTAEIVEYFKKFNFFQAIETSGLFPVPENLDWISVSPKVAEHVIKRNFTHVSELRYVRHKGQSIPQPAITADHYFLSPHSDGFEINQENLRHCEQLCQENPQWKVSIQKHKIWKVL